MNEIDISRHVSVFSPDMFAGKGIDVIGAGATGSRVVLSLAKLGLSNIRVWDFDKVEAHNIANQVYGLGHIGLPKVEALAAIVKEQTGLEIQAVNERVDGSQKLDSLVFLLTDTMASRRQIWEKAIRYKLHVKLMIETRMGTDQGRVYAVCPAKANQVKGWEATLYSDDVAERSACGTSISVGPTAEFLSGLAVWQMIRWNAIETDRSSQDQLNHEILFGLRPLYFMTRQL